MAQPDLSLEELKKCVDQALPDSTALHKIKKLKLSATYINCILIAENTAFGFVKESATLLTKGPF
jgi:hypothetical protein